MVLMDRNTAGFRVELRLRDGSLFIYGATEQHEAEGAVNPQDGLHAFAHPCLYLDNPAAFFDRRTAESVADDDDVSPAPAMMDGGGYMGGMV